MHLELLYLILSLFVGITSISIALIFLIISKDKFYIGTLLFFIPFSILIIEKTVTDYIIINKIDVTGTYWLFSIIINILSYRFLYFSLPFFMHEIVPVSHKKAKNISIFIFSSVVIIIEVTGICILYSIYPDNWKTYSEWGWKYWDIVLNCLFLLIIIYSVLILIIHFKRIENKYFRRIARDLFLIIIIAFPFILLNVIGYFFQEIGIFNFNIYNYYYVIILPLISVAITIHISGYFFNSLNIGNELKPDENILIKYDITDREKEIIGLILKGYNNKRIGSHLFISVSTVKKHIYSIFRKTKVKSRFELIALLQKI